MSMGPEQEKWVARNRAHPEMLVALRAMDELGKWWGSEEAEAVDPWDRYQRLMGVVGLARVALTKAGE